MIWRAAARALHGGAKTVGPQGRATVTILAKPRRWLIAGVAALAVAVALPLSADAAASGTVGFSIAGSATAEVPFSITVSGTSSQERTLLVYVFSGSPACPANASEVQGGDLHNEGSVSAGSYSKSLGAEQGAGTYTLCGYLTDVGAGGTYATGTYTFQVAPTPPPTPSPAPSEPSAPAPTPTPAAPHLTTLSVRTHSHAGITAAKPGETELLVSVAPDAVLRVVLRRHGHTLTKRVSVGARSSGKIIVPWSCSAPGGVYSYAIKATDAYGASLTRTGKFRGVSAARCHALKIENEPLPETPQERQHEKQEEAHRQHVEAVQRAYCHDLGGYVLLQDGVAEETQCVVGSLVYELKGDPPRVVHVRRN